MSKPPTDPIARAEYMKRKREYQRQYYARHREKILARQKIHRQENNEEVCRRKREYRYRNHEEILEKERLYREKNVERNRQRQRAYYRRYRKEIASIRYWNRRSSETIRDYYRKYRRENREKIRKYQREYNRERRRKICERKNLLKKLHELIQLLREKSKEGEGSLWN